jgi:beta-1,4-mannosyltransferase
VRVLGWPAFSPDTGNPYNALLYGALERRDVRVDEFSPRRLLLGRYDVWHIHWPERIAHQSAALARLLCLALLVLWAKARGTRIVWTAHNLEGHARRHPRLERGFMRWLTRRVDGLVALSASVPALAAERYPGLDRAASAVVRHGHYVGRYPNEIGQASARLLLGLGERDRVLAVVGRIQPYKNVEGLISEFRRLEEPDARLVVAGRPASPELRLTIEQAAGGDERIRLYLDEVPDGELQVFLNAADVVAVPHERILNSATALLALSFGRPVLVPGTAAMRELRDQLGREAVRIYSSPLSAAHLAIALSRPAPDPLSLLSRVESEHDWEQIARRTLGLYERVCAASRSRSRRSQRALGLPEAVSR